MRLRERGEENEENEKKDEWGKVRRQWKGEGRLQGKGMRGEGRRSNKSHDQNSNWISQVGGWDSNPCAINCCFPGAVVDSWIGSRGPAL